MFNLLNQQYTQSQSAVKYAFAHMVVMEYIVYFGLTRYSVEVMKMKTMMTMIKMMMTTMMVVVVIYKYSCC